MASPIPLIDFSTPQTSEQLAGQVLDALASVGFLHVAGLPGLDKETIANAFSIHKDLYDSPVAERLSCPHDFATRNGHQRFKDMSLGEKGGGADSKEAFVYGHHGTELGETDQPLPPALERRRDEVQQFKETCHAAFCDLLDKISIAMKLPVKFFADAHFIGNNSLSFINYPPITREDSSTASAEGSRAGAHKDWGTITLLFQEENGTPGLEIFLPNADVVAAQSDKPYVLTKDTDLSRGRWVAAPVIAGSVLIDVGLALETWTNGLYKANLHRVVFPSTAESTGFPGRRSIAFFSQPRLEVVLNPVGADGVITETTGALTLEQFFLERMKAAAAY